MKNILASGLLAMMIFAASCTKNATSNFWSFEGTTYSAAKVASTANVLEATNSTGGAVSFTFYGTSLPAASGTYTVVYNAPTTGNQVSIALTNSGGTTYYSSGASGATTIYVSVSGGKVSISATSAVTLVNGNIPSDSSTSFTATISQ